MSASPGTLVNAADSSGSGASPPPVAIRPFLLVASDFVRTGGMDMANLALATYLADEGYEVHLVAHSAERDLTARSNVTLHRIRRPANSNLLAAPLLDRAGKYWARRIAARGGRVLVNGGNCGWGDLNWVHYVHAAYRPRVSGNFLRRARWNLGHRYFKRKEREALRRAPMVLANSWRTCRDLVEFVGVPVERIRVVYLGADADRMVPPGPEEIASVRTRLQWDRNRPRVAFVGELGDRRKGFDTLFAAWEMLCADAGWDADLAVAGGGGELAMWRQRAAQAGLRSRIDFLGFRSDVPDLLAACDLLIAPSRYEPYGLAVQEAVCRGIPALVGALAGIAERYPADLAAMILPDPENADDLATRIRAWRERPDEWKVRFRPFSADLRANTWTDMARNIADIALETET